MERRPFLPSLFGSGSDLRGSGDPFTSLQREVNRMFDDVFRTGLPAVAGRESAVLSPSIDVREREDHIEVHAELPGVKPEDVDITLDDDIVTLRGEKKFERTEDKENLHVMERSYGSFARSLRLPFSPDPDQVKADFADGVLTIRMPRPAEQRQRQRHIQIGRGGGQQGGKASIGTSSAASQSGGQSGGSDRREAASASAGQKGAENKGRDEKKSGSAERA